MKTKDKVIDILKNIYDPEMPCSLWDLGLIYNIDTKVGNKGNVDVNITMTLTTTGCGMAEMMGEEIKGKVKLLNRVGNCNVELTFDPAWSPDMMSDEARIAIGI
jgi:metal-sulfur cluster biosynthetic enzyme